MCFFGSSIGPALVILVLASFGITISHCTEYYAEGDTLQIGYNHTNHTHCDVWQFRSENQKRQLPLPKNVTSKYALEIVNLTLADSGLYNCLQNQSLINTVRVIVFGSNEIPHPPKVIYIDTHKTQNVSLACYAAPCFKLKWILPNNSTAEKENRTRLVNTSDQSSGYTQVQLQIVNLKESDNGDYECLLTNPYNGQSNSFKQRIDTRVDRSDLLEQDKFVLAGKEVSVICGLVPTQFGKTIWFYRNTTLVAGIKTYSSWSPINGVSNEEYFDQFDTIKFKPTVSGQLKCRFAYEPNETAPRSAVVNLYVQHKEKDLLMETHPSSEGIFRGNKTTIECYASMYVFNETVEIQRNGVALTDGINGTNTTQTIIENMYVKTVVFERIALQDAGLYVCVVNTLSGQRREEQINIEVKGSPTFNTSTQAYTLASSDKLDLYCGVSGHPVPTITWFINDMPIKSTTLPNMRIIRENVTVGDSGKYKCIATNVYGQASQTFYVSVVANQGPPKLHFNDKYQINNFTITCYASIPSILTWTLPSKCNAEAENRTKSTISVINGVMTNKLQVFNITVHDEGDYECVCTNPQNNQTSSVEQFVKIADPGEINRIQQPKISFDGKFRINNFSITCYASTTLPLKWTLPSLCNADAENRTERISSVSQRQQRQNTLRVVNITELDEGNYTCVLTDPQTNQSSSVTQFVKIADRSGLRMNNAIAMPGTTVSITCSIVGMYSGDITFFYKSCPWNKTTQFPAEKSCASPWVAQRALLESEDYTGEETIQLKPTTPGWVKCHYVMTDNATAQLDAIATVYIQDTVLGEKDMVFEKSSTNVFSGNSTFVKCFVSMYFFGGKPSIRRNGIPVAERTNELIINQQVINYMYVTTVTFLKITQLDAGMYACVGQTYDRHMREEYLQIVVNYPPRITPPKHEITDVKVLQLDTLELFCNVTGFPAPSLQWFKDTKAIDSATRKQLSINGVSVNDGGLYECLVANAYGKSSKKFRVSITPNGNNKKIAIGVIVFFFVLGVLLVFAFVFYRRKRTRRDPPYCRFETSTPAVMFGQSES